MDERQLENLAVSLKTPSFVFDTDILKARAAHVAEKVKPAKLCFAIKANPFLLQAMDEEVERYEVCSPGEFHISPESIKNMKMSVMRWNRECSILQQSRSSSFIW